ncbi:MAG: hypothetical protein U9O64_06420 [Campylobacterota bacterium]|nr:hypothetical protein [Campylobacterota bacterium]
MVFIIFAKALGFFDTLNHFIYNKTTGLYLKLNDIHDEFILVDASNMNQADLTLIIQRILDTKPHLMVADISHHIPFITEKIERMVDEYAQLIVAVPIFKEESYKDRYADKLLSYPLYEEECRWKGSGKNNIINYFTDDDPSYLFDDIKFVNYNQMLPFPKFFAKDIVEGNTISELFTDKIVVLSTFESEYAYSPQQKRLGQQFLHLNTLGFMLKSAMEDRWLKRLSLNSYYVCILLFIFFSIMIIYLYVNYIQYVIFTMLVSITALYWLMLSYTNIMLPFSDLLIIFLILVLYLLHYTKSVAMKEESSLIRNLSYKLREKVVHTSFFNSNQSWQEMAALINKLFPLEKSIFLEKVRNDKYVHEVVSLNCEFEDFTERRRDVTREPYLSAAKERRLTISSRVLFKELKKDKKEFIMPLIYFNETIGFWIFTIDEKCLTEIENIKEDLSLCSQEVSRLLYEHRRFQKNRLKHQETFFNKFISIYKLEIKNPNIIAIKNSFSIFMKRMHLTEIIMDNIHSNIIVYDIFGKVVNINNNMNSLLQKENIKTYTLNAREMLEELTDMDRKDIVKLMKNIVYDKSKHEEIIHFKHTNKRYLLNIVPITQEKIENKFTGNYFMGVYGIIFEFIDFSYIDHIIELKSDVLHSSIRKSQSYLTGLDRLLDKYFEQCQNIQNDKKIFLETKINSNILELKALNNELKEYIADDYTKTLSDIYPINIIKMLQDISKRMKEEYAVNNIEIDLHTSETDIYVMVRFEKVRILMRTLLSYLIDDCDENGIVSIHLNKHHKILEIVMQSSGVGMPQIQLDTFLNAEDISGFSKVSKALIPCNGTVKITSSMGSGIRVVLTCSIVNNLEL